MDPNRLSTSAEDPDPWSSPSNTFRSTTGKKAVLNEESASGRGPQRTTSAYSTSVGNNSTNSPNAPVTATGDAADWGATGFPSARSDGFSGEDPNAESGFATRGGNDGDGSARPGRKIPRRHVSHGTQEVLTVAGLPDKEGMFLFQYRNYEISSNRRSTKVIRRYSDFVWLLDCLHKRYPFRLLPLLPPKRVASE